MKLTRADFKDALEDAWSDLECAIEDSATEREQDGKPDDCTMDKIILESAKVTALRYYLKYAKDAK